jgi:hypothetical protein
MSAAKETRQGCKHVTFVLPAGKLPSMLGLPFLLNLAEKCRTNQQQIASRRELTEGENHAAKHFPGVGRHQHAGFCEHLRRRPVPGGTVSG